MTGVSTRSHRLTTSDAASKTDMERARKARKRDTDRQSQRHHRERQRAYVQKLEEMVNSYKQSCSQSGHPDVATLMADNEKLRERCHRLESLLSRIHSLSGGVDLLGSTKDSCSSPSNVVDQTEDNQSMEAPRQTVPMPNSVDELEDLPPATFATITLSNEGQDRLHETENRIPTKDVRLEDISTIEGLPSISASLSETPIDTEANPDSLTDCSKVAGYTTMAISNISNSHDNCFDLLGSSDKETAEMCQADIPNFEYYSAQISNMNNSEDDNTTLSFELGSCMGSIIDGTALNLDLTEQQQGPASPLTSISLCSIAVNAEYQALPRTTAACTWDKILLGIIDEAKTQHATGLYPIQKPTLHSVLSNRSSDVLAYRLYHFICAYGPMPLHNLLAIFWVQYLALRWYVLGTRAAYLQVPDFMKPTDLERRIPHSMSIGMLVWPDIRRTLIRDSWTADTEATGTSLLYHLSSDWSPTHWSGSDMIGSTDVLSVIERQACNIDAGKISRKFGELNPQFAHCQLLLYD